MTNRPTGYWPKLFVCIATGNFFTFMKNITATALDAGRLAEALGVKHLVLYHTEDKTLAERKEAYTREASSVFTGRVYVPDDLERISLE